MKKIIISIVLILYAFAVTAQEKQNVLKGFSGGMMVHTGYLSGCDNPYGFDAAGATLA